MKTKIFLTGIILLIFSILLMGIELTVCAGHVGTSMQLNLHFLSGLFCGGSGALLILNLFIPKK